VNALATVLIMRHCLRSCPSAAKGGADGFDFLSNYTSTSHEFASFPVEDYMCLPEGLTMVEAVGSSLSLPTPVTVEVDSGAQRDIDTGAALMRGIGLDVDEMIEAPCLFKPTSCGYCKELDVDVKKDAVQQRLEEFPMTDEVASLIDEFQERLGLGPAPAFGDIDNYVDSESGYYSGGASIASQISEYILMQMGGNLTFGWGELTREDVYRYLETHIFYRGVQDRSLTLALRDHSYMSREILDTLKAGEGGTRIMVGHDGDLDALAEIFGLQWFTPPFPPNATTPGSGIRFDLDEDGGVSVSLHYQAFDGGDEVLFADATWTWEEGGTVTVENLEAHVGGILNEDCYPSE